MPSQRCLKDLPLSSAHLRPVSLARSHGLWLNLEWSRYPLDEAESFGLNRAIFYAAAKRGFKGGTGSKHPGEQHVLKESPGRNITKTIQQDALGDEGAFYVEMD